MQHKLMDIGKKHLLPEAPKALAVAEKMHEIIMQVKPDNANIPPRDILDKYFFVLYPALLAAQESTLLCSYNTRVVLLTKLQSCDQVTKAQTEKLLALTDEIEATGDPIEILHLYSVVATLFAAPVSNKSSYTDVTRHNPESDLFFAELPSMIRNVFHAMHVYEKSRDLYEKNKAVFHDHAEAAYYEDQFLNMRMHVQNMISTICFLGADLAGKGYEKKGTVELKKWITVDDLKLLFLVEKHLISDDPYTDKSKKQRSRAEHFISRLTALCNRAAEYQAESKTAPITPTMFSSPFRDTKESAEVDEAILDVYDSVKPLIRK
jgi:hypothetical protein